MKKNPLPLLLLVIGLVLGLGLLFGGCNRNEAKQTAATTESEVSQNLAELEKELIEREIVLSERLEVVEQREDELTRREQAVVTEPEPVLEPEPEAEPEPFIVMLTLPATTELELEILDPVSTATSVVGDPVRAAVVRDVLQDGLLAIPAGSRVFGTVEGMVAEKKIAGQALLSIRFDELELTSGETLAIRAFLDIEGKDQKKKDAATIGGSTAGGAILGRILSKNDKTKGTVIGAVLGAAIGTAVASKNQTDPVVIEPGTVLVVQLDSPVDLAVEDVPAVERIARY